MVQLSQSLRTLVIIWLLTAIYYFYQYMLCSAPVMMMPELSNAFELSDLQVVALVGLFCHGYSPFSFVAGIAMDRMGPRKVIPMGQRLLVEPPTEELFNQPRSTGKLTTSQEVFTNW